MTKMSVLVTYATGGKLRRILKPNAINENIDPVDMPMGIEYLEGPSLYAETRGISGDSRRGGKPQFLRALLV
ncbi:MAG: hypothetical protein WBN09_10520, partial [Woeseiaceae bacterium]